MSTVKKRSLSDVEDDATSSISRNKTIRIYAENLEELDIDEHVIKVEPNINDSSVRKVVEAGSASLQSEIQKQGQEIATLKEENAQLTQENALLIQERNQLNKKLQQQATCNAKIHSLNSGQLQRITEENSRLRYELEEMRAYIREGSDRFLRRNGEKNIPET